MLDLLDEAENHTIAEWAPNAKDCKTPYTALLGTNSKRLAMKSSSIAPQPTSWCKALMAPLESASVCGLHERARKSPFRARREPWYWIKQEIMHLVPWLPLQCLQSEVHRGYDPVSRLRTKARGTD